MDLAGGFVSWLLVDLLVSLIDFVQYWRCRAYWIDTDTDDVFVAFTVGGLV